MIDVIPGIFEKEWSEIERKVRLVAPYVEWVQIDIADGTLVPAQTFLAFEKFKPLIAAYDQHGLRALHFEAHLMIASPEKITRQLSEIGFERIIVQVEANDPRLFLDEARLESVEVGLALDGGSEVAEIEPFLEEIDVGLVMMAEAGSKGLILQPENLEKVRAIRSHFPDLPIAAEEGINEATVRVIKDAGATRLVSTSYLFKDSAKIAQAIKFLKEA